MFNFLFLKKMKEPQEKRAFAVNKDTLYAAKALITQRCNEPLTCAYVTIYCRDMFEGNILCMTDARIK